VTAGHEESTVIRARNITMQTRPDRVQSFFESQFRRVVPADAPARPAAIPIKALPSDDPYGF